MPGWVHVALKQNHHRAGNKEGNEKTIMASEGMQVGRERQSGCCRWHFFQTYVQIFVTFFSESWMLQEGQMMWHRFFYLFLLVCHRSPRTAVWRTITGIQNRQKVTRTRFGSNSTPSRDSSTYDSCYALALIIAFKKFFEGPHCERFFSNVLFQVPRIRNGWYSTVKENRYFKTSVF